MKNDKWLVIILHKKFLQLNIVKPRDVRFDYRYQADEICKKYYVNGWKFVKCYETDKT